MDPALPCSSLHLENTIWKLSISAIESREGTVMNSKVHVASSVNEQSGSSVFQQSQGILPISMKTLIIDDKEITPGVEQIASGESAEVAAAVTVQKVYRSYRTRRNLADCAVIARKFGWWNVLESALLQKNSVTFYAFGKNDSVANRWSRLQRKAAKVGKGLSKDEKARKLALQHWLEAIDARHRYGHNLHYYYSVWQESVTPEPFFYWLDVGEGRDLDLPACPRSKLQNQQIKYLGPKEREHYEVVVKDGKLIYKKSGELLNTLTGEKWIFVMSTSGKLYVAQKEKGKLQHSSFLAGAATTAAGRLLARDGILQLMEAHSGHYHPTEENFKELVNILTKLGADLKMAKVQTVSDDMLNPHQEELLRTSSESKGAESIELVIKQSETTSPSLHELKEVKEPVQEYPSKPRLMMLSYQNGPLELDPGFQVSLRFLMK
eukprot:c28176_g1_i2 orf=563-1870(-)